MTHLHKDILSEIAAYVEADVHRLFFGVPEGAATEYYGWLTVDKPIAMVPRGDLRRGLPVAAPAVSRLWRAVFGPVMVKAQEHFHMVRTYLGTGFYCGCNREWCPKGKPINIKSISSARGIEVIRYSCDWFEMKFNMGPYVIAVGINVPYNAVIHGEVGKTYNQSTIMFEIKNTDVPSGKDIIKRSDQVWRKRRTYFSKTKIFNCIMERFKDKYGTIIKFSMLYAVNSTSVLHVKPFKFNHIYEISSPSIMEFKPIINLAQEILGWSTLTYQSFSP